MMAQMKIVDAISGATIGVTGNEKISFLGFNAAQN